MPRSRTVEDATLAKERHHRHVVQRRAENPRTQMDRFQRLLHQDGHALVVAPHHIGRVPVDPHVSSLQHLEGHGGAAQRVAQLVGDEAEPLSLLLFVHQTRVFGERFDGGGDVLVDGAIEHAVFLGGEGRMVTAAHFSQRYRERRIAGHQLLGPEAAALAIARGVRGRPLGRDLAGGHAAEATKRAHHVVEEAVQVLVDFLVAALGHVFFHETRAAGEQLFAVLLQELVELPHAGHFSAPVPDSSRLRRPRREASDPDRAPSLICAAVRLRMTKTPISRKRSCAENGFTSCASQQSARAARSIASESSALASRMGMRDVRSLSRKRRATSRPSPSGSRRSSTMMSGRNKLARRKTLVAACCQLSMEASAGSHSLVDETEIGVVLDEEDDDTRHAQAHTGRGHEEAFLDGALRPGARDSNEGGSSDGASRRIVCSSDLTRPRRSRNYANSVRIK